MRDLWEEFKEFAIGGNLIQLAVAFVLGVAFAAVVTSLVDDIFMPIIGAIVSDDTFANLSFEVGGAEVRYGNFLTVLVNFLLIALILFIVIKGYNQLRREEEAPVDTKPCPFCASTIPLAAVRCPHCTSELSA
ncbi:MAG TPA: large conductance mechanosensitive channel protein MscL [Thermomicrobiales bacterium]|nr:large conductance mechanosensitive channel protein MscL [Thermomicrobiales bacterium]